MRVEANPEFTPDEAALLNPYFTNMDQPVFALTNLPEVVKGALFSRYSRTEKSLRRVLLDEFLNQPELGFHNLPVSSGGDGLVARQAAEEFYDRVLVGFGDDSVAELAGAHLAVEQVSILAAKALEDSRIGISPLEKSTRYVRFDRPGRDGRFMYHRGPELAVPAYEGSADRLFETYSELIDPLIARVRETYPIEDGESERAWKAATKAKALDLLRGLLPAGTLTNLGLYGNGRAFEYLIIKLAANEFPETQRLARAIHTQLSLVMASFVRRALDPKYGEPAIGRLVESRERLRRLARPGSAQLSPPSVRLIDFDPHAEAKVVAAALFGTSEGSLGDLTDVDSDAVLQAAMAGRANRRQRAPRAFEHSTYTFEVVANFAAYRDLHRHRMLTQDRQLLGTDLGFDLPPLLVEWGLGARVEEAVQAAAETHAQLVSEVGGALAQYVLPIGFRVRWYMRVNLREIYHLCELRTTPQGHPDYRWVAQEMFQRVQEVHPRLAAFGAFVDMGPGDDLERRRSERRIDTALAGA
ncbi:MAG TPA: FAD-dependent thymidylate synthase [Candidatus Dormibacteraeota bacterium]|nr:FAD-dependent thymidylate synthase [Candidatus Dormibacteraeota bacterium]